MSPVTPSDLNRLHDLARQRAAQLRAQAIDDFWRGADAAWAATLTGARRSAQRLAHRLAHHARARQAQHQAAPSARQLEG